MKRYGVALMLALVLCGCGAGDADPVYETIGSPDYEPVSSAQPQELLFDLPEAVACEAVSADDGSRAYIWEDYTVVAQTLPGGDLEQTVTAISGFDAGKLTVMAMPWHGITLYQTVWCATGEDGDSLSRAMIADDGAYHYCVTVTGPQDGGQEELYATVVSSARLASPDSEK